MINFLFFIYIGIIFFISTIYIDLVNKIYYYDSYIHFTMYFLLGVFVLFQEKKNYLLKLILALIIPLLTEYIQNFIDLRRSDVIDLYYNYLGLFLGILTIVLIRYVRKT
ncbi:MAG: hypothetical protein CMG26_01530 [Candidatus Marinimicrobia bacterium]|nr:hypothetical protein [Candidatus Neomarinimicrobiota bacterium]MAM99046.1 hypothetical protein [Candidatus Neomarinimicrobiota bacterium]MBV67019.1 hypothetical protein [Candidatus Neomarinimicrobiota bacterium]|tara:strand:+ start:164 stop:490 length:327 start_codon:yes stop_codon:yes gene_type:complete